MAKPRDRIQRVMTGGAAIGGATNKSTIGTDGSIVQAGTQANTIGATTFAGANTFSLTQAFNGVATLAAAPVLSGSGRSTRRGWIGPEAWYISGASITDGTLNSLYRSLYFHPDASTSDVVMYAQWQVPADFDGTYGVQPKVWWSRGSGTASGIADFDVSVVSLATGENTGTASVSSIAAGASGQTNASANVLFRSALSIVGANVITANDLLSLVCKLEGSDGLTTAGCPYCLGVELEYKAAAI